MPRNRGARRSVDPFALLLFSQTDFRFQKVVLLSPAMLRTLLLSRPVRIPQSGKFPLLSLSRKPFRSIASGQSAATSSWRSILPGLKIPVGLFGRRPMLELFRQDQNLEFSRGMKVRTSVKKLCDACRVSGDRYIGTVVCFCRDASLPKSELPLDLSVRVFDLIVQA